MSEYLLDTHVLLWWLFNDSRLSYRCRDILKDRRNTVLVSAATGWEIATKVRIGKLPEVGDLVDELPALLRRSKFDTLDITLDDSLLAGRLEFEHRDPFDRMLIAQSKNRELPIITSDGMIQDLAETVW